MSAWARPFLKWAGGKTQLLDQFARLYPTLSDNARYIEPFLGGGAVFLHVRELLDPATSVLSDENEAVIGAYLAVRDDVESLIRILARHHAAHSKEHFYRVRSRIPGRMSRTARAARLIYLNRTCFNGLYRVNSRGGFNVPMGRYKSPRILDAANLRAASAALSRAVIDARHFRTTASSAQSGDFVYFDPPYHPLSRTANFTSYTQDSFSVADQEELAELYSLLARRGCHVMLSNSDCAPIRSLYRGFDIRTVMARRTINSDARKRGPVREVVVLNYEPAAATGLIMRAGSVSSAASPRARQAMRQRLPPVR